MGISILGAEDALGSEFILASQLSAEMTRDAVAATRIGRIRFDAQPGLRIGKIFVLGGENASPLGYWRIDARFRLNADHVFLDGGDPKFIGKNQLFQVGPRIALRWRGSFDQFTSRMHASVSYEFLYNAAGSPRGLRRLEASAGYSITDNASIDARYFFGEEDRTLQRLHFWEITFGLKF